MCVNGGYGDPDLRLGKVPSGEGRRRRAAGHAFTMEIISCHIGQQPSLALPHLRDMLDVYDGDLELVKAHFIAAGDEIQKWVNKELARLQAQPLSILTANSSAS